MPRVGDSVRNMLIKYTVPANLDFLHFTLNQAKNPGFLLGYEGVN